MAIIALIFAGVLLVVAIAVFAGAVGPFLRIRALHNATVTPVGAVVKGSRVTLRGVVAEARRDPPYPRLTDENAVFSTLEVIEQVGKQTNVAFKGTNAQVFALRDEKGNTIDIDPRHAKLVDGHDSSARLDQSPLEFKNWVNGQGSFHHQKTPAQCIESAILVGQRISVVGQAILPLPGQHRDGDTELRITATEMSVLTDSPWSGNSGRTLLAAMIAIPVLAGVTLGCAAWAGVF